MVDFRQQDRKFVSSAVTERSSVYNAEPSTAMVLNAFAREALHGTGTLDETIAAVDADRERGNLSVTGPVSLYKYLEDKFTERSQSKVLSQQEWMDSQYYRPSISYEDGMTERLAEILAEQKDRETRLALTVQNSTGWQKAAGMTTAFGLGIFEPRNLTIGVAAAIATGGIGALAAPAASGTAAATTGTRVALGARRVVGAVGSAQRAAVEGLIGAAVLEPGNWSNATTLDKDYTLADSLFNVGTSVAFSAALQGGVNYIGKRRARAVTQAEAQDATLVAITQAAEGHAIDTTPVHDYYDAQAQSLEPPVNYTAEELKRMASLPDDSGVHDFFIQEAREVRQYFNDTATIVDRSPSEVAQIIGYSPKSIKQVVKDLGGLNAVAELKNRGITNKSLPGLVRKIDPETGKGLGNNIDEIGAALKEKGFFPEKAADEITMDDVIDALERDIAGDRVYPETVENDLAANSVAENIELQRSLDEAGITADMSEEDIAKALQVYYADEGIPFGEVNREISQQDLDRTLGTPDEILAQYEAESSVDRMPIYDDFNPAETEWLAKSIKSENNEIADMQADIAELEIEIGQYREAGYLDEDLEKLLDDADEYIEEIELRREIVEASATCLIGGGL